MKRRFDVAILGGAALILMGLLFMLQNLGLVEGAFAWLWVIVFGLGGAAFLGVFVSDREQWWGLIPGIVLLGIAMLIALSQAAPALMDRVGGGVFLGAISLSFWCIYLMRREQWWAVIPGGVLGTLAVVASLSSVVGGVDLGAVFF
ncbi:MAG: hypothetical protein GX605_01515, partial [Chloroflexi bacterium]|nr:hypothetical protein [Chloroflexota bacterium]